MSKPIGEPPPRPLAEGPQQLRWLALAANDIADELLQCEPQQAAERGVQAGLVYARALGADRKALEAATLRARERLQELARAVDFQAAPGSGAARLLTPPTQRTVTLRDTPSHSVAQDTVAGLELHATQPAGAALPGTAAQDARRVSEMLAAGIQDITDAMVEDFKLADVLRMILETMYRAMRFRRVVFCMRDLRSDALTGRFGLGAGVEEEIRRFRIPLRAAQPDLFAAVCLKGVDTLISDTADPRVATRLPEWYRSAVQAPAFLLLPLLHKGAPFGLIYADQDRPGQLELDEKELALLRTLRNQAVMAFRQAG